MIDVDDLVEKIYKHISLNINDEWNSLQKIRYIYLETGKFLEKNTDFFLNDKLESSKKGVNEINNIYDNDIIYERDYYKSKYYQVICKSAAVIMNSLFNKFNIWSSCVVTCSKDDFIKHWFIVVRDDDYKQYFLTIAADLPFIKNNFPTMHFANTVKYMGINNFKCDDVSSYDKLVEFIKSNGRNIDDYVVVYKNNKFFVTYIVDYKYLDFSDEIDGVYKVSEFKDKIIDNKLDVTLLYRQYDIPPRCKLITKCEDINGIKFKYDEIDCKSLSPVVSDELKELDMSIGYSSLYQVEDSKINLTSYYDKLNKEYIEYNSELYNIFSKSFHLNGNCIKKIDDITKEEVDEFINSLDIFIASYLINYFDTNLFNKDNYIICFFDINNIKYDKSNIKKSIKNIRKESNDEEINNILDMLLKVIYIKETFKKFIDIKINKEKLEEELYDKKLISENEDVKKLIDLINQYNNIKKLLSFKKINQAMLDLCYLFVKEDINDEFISQDYIYDKFCRLFPLIFDCNYGDYNTVKFNNFSKQSYSEQVVIIKKFLEHMFPELNYKNSSLIPTYDNNYSPVENRIRVLPVKDRKTGDYVIGFRFWAALDSDEEERCLLYIPKENLLREFSLTDSKKYYMVTSNVSKLLEDIEDIEDNDELKLKRGL